MGTWNDAVKWNTFSLYELWPTPKLMIVTCKCVWLTWEISISTIKIRSGKIPEDVSMMIIHYVWSQHDIRTQLIIDVYIF